MNKLLLIKDNIERMEKCHQIEILKIFYSEKSNVINENSNGVFINLVDISDDIIQKLEDYIIYVDKQQKHLFNIEQKKLNIENTFFKNKDKEKNKDNKDSAVYNLANA